jgi:myo-inositol 2-dehydrogenase/D-chiro-inositol 1-dehydrogenase
MARGTNQPIGVGIVGSRFMAGIHCDSVRQIPDTRVVGVASPTGDHAQRFAETRGIPHAFTDYRDLVALPEIDLVIVTSTNDGHAAATIAAAQAGKHVIVEKPLCLNLVEADAMIAACREAGVKLMYAEEFCFAPKYVRVKEVIDEGAIGRVFRMNHTEKGRGPANPWYWDLERSGGWSLMQLGSHALGIVRWMLDRCPATSVYARLGQHFHRDRGRGDDDAVIIVEFGDDLSAVIDVSWGKLGGMDDRMEIIGTGGVTQADLYFGSAFRTYSEPGYRYSAPGGGPTSGWTHTVYDELHNNGFPQEIAHFVACVRDDLPPQETGEDGRAVIEIIMAAYESARTGRKVPLPFHSDARLPIDLWWPTGAAAPAGGTDG